MEYFDIKESFDDVFIKSFSDSKFISAKGKEHWLDCELHIDGLCGPLSHIFTGGNCQYIFNGSGIWESVNSPSDLEQWLKLSLFSLHEAISKFAPKTPDEKTDRILMNQYHFEIEKLNSESIKMVGGL